MFYERDGKYKDGLTLHEASEEEMELALVKALNEYISPRRNGDLIDALNATDGVPLK